MPLQRWLPLPKDERPYTESQGGCPLLDEVVFTNVTVHIERMQHGYYWMGITEADDNTLHFGFEVNGKYLDFSCAPDNSAAAIAEQELQAAPDSHPAEPGQLTWVFTGPAEADPGAAAAVLTGFGFRFHPERDQITLGQDHGGYARSGVAPDIKAAFAEACVAAGVPWPEGRPRWSELDYRQRQAVLNFLAESPTWPKPAGCRTTPRKSSRNTAA